MAMSDARKIAVAGALQAACFVFTTNQMIPGYMTMDQAAEAITDGLAEIAADSTDAPQGADLKADLLAVEALASLNPSQLGGHAGEAAAWSVAAAALL